MHPRTTHLIGGKLKQLILKMMIITSGSKHRLSTNISTFSINENQLQSLARSTINLGISGCYGKNGSIWLLVWTEKPSQTLLLFDLRVDRKLPSLLIIGSDCHRTCLHEWAGLLGSGQFLNEERYTSSRGSKSSY